MSIQFYLDSERLAKVINVNRQTYYAFIRTTVRLCM